MHRLFVSLSRRVRACWPNAVGISAPSSPAPSALLRLGFLCRNHPCMLYAFDLLKHSITSSRHYVFLRCLLRKRAPSKLNLRLHVHLECSRNFCNLAPERTWGRLLAVLLSANIAAEGAIAVISTLGGAYATLRQSRLACSYAVKLYQVARFMGDKSRMLRAQVYYMLGTIMGCPPTPRVLNQLRLLQRKARALGDADVSGLVEYAHVRLIPEIYSADKLSAKA